MTLLYYNAILDQFFIVESEYDASLMMFANLAVTNRDHGWWCLGEL
jgi:hypothetical protein